MRLKLIILLFTFVLLSQLVLAQDFSATAHSQIDTCACSIVTDTLIISNSAIVSDFSLSQKGSAAGWTVLSDKEFTVGSIERKEVEEYIKIPCNVEGDFNLITEFETNTRVTKQLEQQISVRQCDNAKVIPKQTRLSGCRCSQFIYYFDVENTGNFEETYSFNVDKLEDYASVSAPFTLSPGERRGAVLAMHLPCDMDESYDFNLITEADRNNFEIKTPLTMNVEEYCAAGNFTYTKPFWQGFQKYSGKVLFAIPIILAVTLLVIILVAALRVPKKPKEKPNIERRYKWDRVFKEHKPKEKKETNFVFWVVLFLAIIILVVNSFAISKLLSPSLNETKPAEADDANVTESSEPGLFDSFFNTKISPVIKGEVGVKGFFNTKITPWIKGWFAQEEKEVDEERNKTTTDKEVEDKEEDKEKAEEEKKKRESEEKEKKEAEERKKQEEEAEAEKKKKEDEKKTQPGPGKIQEPEESGSKISLLTKAKDVLKKAGVAIKDFVISYLYYIVGGLVILALIIGFLVLKEKQAKKAEVSGTPKKKSRQK